MSELAARIQKIEDWIEIRNLIYKYCRALDRHDWTVLASVYKPGAYDDHGANFKGDAAGFADAMKIATAEFSWHSHHVTNVLLAIDGNFASGESYAIAIGQKRLPDLRRFEYHARYVDRFEKCAGVWLIARRIVVHDAFNLFDASSEATSGLPGLGIQGRQDKTDPSYDFTEDARQWPKF